MQRSVRRVRRPSDKSALLDQLTHEGPFEAYRDVLGFAASLGFFHGRRVPFEKTAEPIAWETFTNRQGNEMLVDMIAAAVVDDVNILSGDAFEERLRIFEEYANGGLEILQERLSNSRRSAADAVHDLISE